MPTTQHSVIGDAGAVVRSEPAQSHQHLPCPRCDSINTKFCYYNNYNLSQPRHFCKSCRRYWTHGGTLRNIPVGGGTRKNSNKRSRNPNPDRIGPSPAETSSGSSSVGCGAVSNRTDQRVQLPVSAVASLPGGTPGGFGFTSLLNSQGGCGSSEYATFGGFGLGLASSGFEDIGFGLGRGVWPYHEVGVDQGGSHGCDGNVHGSAAPSWGGAEHGFGDGEYGFPWPDLAISMSGRPFK